MVVDVYFDAVDWHVLEVRIGHDVQVELLEERIVKINRTGKIRPLERFTVWTIHRGYVGQCAARSWIPFHHLAFGQGAAEALNFVY